MKSISQKENRSQLSELLLWIRASNTLIIRENTESGSIFPSSRWKASVDFERGDPSVVRFILENEAFAVILVRYALENSLIVIRWTQKVGARSRKYRPKNSRSALMNGQNLTVDPPRR